MWKRNKDEYERQKIFILVKEKANLVNKQKDVKSNFKALELQEKQIGRVRNIEFSCKECKDE